MLKIELINSWLQIIVNVTIIVSFILGWHIFFRRRRKIKKNIKQLKEKLYQIKNILPNGKSIDDLLSSTKKEDGSIVQITITTKDGKVIDSTKESIDEYFKHEQQVLEEKISELDSLMDTIDLP